MTECVQYLNQRTVRQTSVKSQVGHSLGFVSQLVFSAAVDSAVIAGKQPGDTSTKGVALFFVLGP